MKGTIRVREPRALWWTTALLQLVAIGGVLGVLGGFWSAISGRVIGTLSDPYLTLANLPQVRQAEPIGDGLRVIDESLGLRLLAYAPAIVLAGAVAFACWWGVPVLRKIAAGRPFAPEVVGGVRRIGLMLTVGGLASGGLDLIVNAVMLPMVFADRWAEHYRGFTLTGGEWPLSYIIFGLVVLTAARAFRAGAVMQEELRSVV